MFFIRAQFQHARTTGVFLLMQILIPMTNDFKGLGKKLKKQIRI